jgi:hypothetical protein
MNIYERVGAEFDFNFNIIEALIDIVAKYYDGNQ